MTGSLFFLCVCVCVCVCVFLLVADEPWNGAPAICGLVCVCVCVYVCVCLWAVVQRPLGRLGCCPTFLALMSDRDHLTGLKTSVTCLYLAAVAAAARAQHCSCFPKCAGQSMIMRKDILIRAVATWGRHAGSLSGGRERGREGGLVTITPPSGSLTGESLAAFLGGN